MKRDCFFLVADVSCREMLKAYLARDQFHVGLGCGPFSFDPAQDIRVDPRLDPGVYNFAHLATRPFRATHERAVVILDADWDGSPGAEKIREHISGNLRVQWEESVVVVIEPELESWIWVTSEVRQGVRQVHPAFLDAFGYKSDTPLRQWLGQSGCWPEGLDKPPRPKEAVERLRRLTRAKQSAAAYANIARRVSVKGCTDPSFLLLVETLRRWFPVEAS
jgi:hypothetical protein